jgi:UDP-N-acetylglucosamine:LPS N-acetylglucosamine transferase
MTRRAILLSGSLGLGHDMPASSIASLLHRRGWHTRLLNSMSLLGHSYGAVGQRVFGSLIAVPGLYDALHFAHLRSGSRVANVLDQRASARAVPALRAELEREPADLVVSVFATGAAAAARL